MTPSHQQERARDIVERYVPTVTGKAHALTKIHMLLQDTRNDTLREAVEQIDYEIEHSKQNNEWWIHEVAALTSVKSHILQALNEEG